jgi:hypothetical protein
MRFFAAFMLVTSTLAGSAVQAQPARSDLPKACQQEASRQALRGEALATFMRRCTAGQVSVPPASETAGPTDRRPASRHDGRSYLQPPTSY